MSDVTTPVDVPAVRALSSRRSSGGCYSSYFGHFGFGQQRIISDRLGHPPRSFLTGLDPKLPHCRSGHRTPRHDSSQHQSRYALNFGLSTGESATGASTRSTGRRTTGTASA